MLDLLQAYLLFLLLVSNYSALSLTPAPKEGCVHCLPPHPPLYFMVRSSVTSMMINPMVIFQPSS